MSARYYTPGRASIRFPVPDNLSCKAPVKADTVVNRVELAMPPKVQAEMAKGFALYMLKAVLDGCASDLVDLGRSNWLR